MVTDKKKRITIDNVNSAKASDDKNAHDHPNKGYLVDCRRFKV